MDLFGYLRRILAQTGKCECEERFNKLETEMDRRFNVVTIQFEDLEQGVFENTSLLNRILAAVEPLPAVKFVFTVEVEGQITEGVQQVKITDVQKFTASIAPVDAKGNPASVQDGSVKWSGPDFLTLTPSADGLSCDVAASGALGSGQVAVEADADLGDGVATINGTLQVEVVAGQATSLSISTTDPISQ